MRAQVLSSGLEGLLVATVDEEKGVEVGGLRGGSAGLERSQSGARCVAQVEIGLAIDGLVVLALSRVLLRFIVLRELVIDPKWRKSGMACQVGIAVL